MPESSSATSSRPKTARQNSALTKNLHPCKNCQQYRKGVRSRKLPDFCSVLTSCLTLQCDRTDWTDWTSSSNSCKHCCGKKSCEPGDWAISNPTSHTEGVCANAEALICYIYNIYTSKMQIILCDPSSP